MSMTFLVAFHNLKLFVICQFALSSCGKQILLFLLPLTAILGPGRLVYCVKPIAAPLLPLCDRSVGLPVRLGSDRPSSGHNIAVRLDQRRM